MGESIGMVETKGMVPLVQATRWSHAIQQPRPNSIFVTQLMATAEQGPETRRPMCATAHDAFTAYRAAQHWVEGAGIRARQKI